MMWEVYHGGRWRKFYSFEAAERWARKQVATLNGRGFSQSADIHAWGTGKVASVRMSGDGRVWTDLLSEAAE